MQENISFLTVLLEYINLCYVLLQVRVVMYTTYFHFVSAIMTNQNDFNLDQWFERYIVVVIGEVTRF